MTTSTKTKKEHADIKLLRKRIRQLIIFEEYEKCLVLNKWIEELINHYDTNRHSKGN
jgi:hypothetical protein